METEQKTLVCPECGKTFTRPQALGSHRAASHGYRRNDPYGPTIVQVNSPYQRPLDEKKLEALENWVDPFGREAVVAYEEKLAEFLPILAQETRDRFRRGDDTLVDPFLTLYLDRPGD